MSDLFSNLEPPCCAVCERPEGDLTDGFGRKDGLAPLGPLSPCIVCGKMICPVCAHELECCQPKKKRRKR